MDVAEFARVVGVGLGRAILYLQTHDAAPYRDAILDACLHNQVYDTQVDPGREQYLFDLITLSGDRDFYRDHLVAAIQSEQDVRDGSQIAALVRLFAQQGDARARQALYDAFATQSAKDTWGLASQIVGLDGTDGLLFAVERLVIGPEESWYPGSLVHAAEEKDGRETVRDRLAAAAKANPRVAAIMATVEEYERPAPNAQAVRERRRQEAADYMRLRQRLQSGEQVAPTLFLPWARDADHEGLVRAANDLLQETDPRQRRAYLMIFHRRPFPLDPAPLIELTKDPDEWTAHFALYGLTHVRHPVVRALALDRLANGDGRGAALFVGNYEDGDYQRIADALVAWQDRDAVHDLGFNLRKVAEAHPVRDAAPALIALYEYGPCMLCRGHAIELLQQAGGVPDWMRAECCHDADPGIRAMTFE